MDSDNVKLLLVFDNDKFKSVLSVGDIQRSLLKSNNFSIEIGCVLRSCVKVANDKQSLEEIKQLMLINRIEMMPIVDKDNNLIDVIFWEDVIQVDSLKEQLDSNIPVVIMAGGEGTRLKPITNIIPKPLVPIGERAFVEIIMDSFKEHGLNTFLLSVNYKADLIKYYFKNLGKPFKISYFDEPRPLGTAGSLQLMKNHITTTFFVSNCDILIDQNYDEILKYHKDNNNELTAVAAIKTYTIPYGTMEIGLDGFLKELKEKPKNTYYVNAGLYILEPHLLKDIPENKFFHITHLMEKIMKRNGKVGVFPVSEGAWMDIGEWSQYSETQKRFNSRFNK